MRRGVLTAWVGCLIAVAAMGQEVSAPDLAAVVETNTATTTQILRPRTCQ